MTPIDFRALAERLLISCDLVEDRVNRVRHQLEATHNAALEAAAHVAVQKTAIMPHYSDLERGYANGRVDAAAEIMALKVES